MSAEKTPSSERLFIGLDASTQGLKATVVDADLRSVGDFAVNYDLDLPEFRTDGGVHKHPDGLTVSAPALMWVQALDLLLDRMQSAAFPFGRVVAISGSGQQHGSVWLTAAAGAALQGLAPARSLGAQLRDAFALADSPIWMDASTRAQCAQREDALGGAQRVAEITGSRAYERFTGNQIAKVHQQQPGVYAQTDRIALVSSFMASLLIGAHAPIDVSDGSGMNLLDIRRRAWNQAALDCTAPDLARRLGDPAPAHAVAGRIHARHAARYGFPADCRVIVFSGDNPCSLAGMRLQEPGDIAISLGTSDTVFGALSEPRPSAAEGHIFASPVDPAGYMAMIVRQNGSLTREHVRELAGCGSWQAFGECVARSPAGNGGRIGIYIRTPEITPTIHQTGLHRFGPDGRPVASFGPAEEARALFEGQMLALRVHCGGIGLEPRQILATGGASVDRALLRIMADVFGVPVFTGDQANSAALGAAYRAVHGWRCAEAGAFVSFAAVTQPAAPFRQAAAPDRAAHAVYTGMLERFAALESKLL
jgi:xylulokinase